MELRLDKRHNQLFPGQNLETMKIIYCVPGIILGTYIALFDAKKNDIGV